MTSTRLPGKVMKRVGGRTILERMIRASSQVPGINVVCAGVPVGNEHDTVAAEAERLGTPVVRGPEFDVLERFRLAAEVIGASEVMRVTTDWPMMDPALCGRFSPSGALRGRTMHATMSRTAIRMDFIARCSPETC